MDLYTLSFADLWALSQFIDKEFAHLSNLQSITPPDNTGRDKRDEQLYLLGQLRLSVTRQMRARTYLEQSA